MAEKTYTVKALMAIVNCDNGTAVHVQKGGAVPGNVDPAHLQHLLDNDIVVESEVVGGLEPLSTGDLSRQVTFTSEAEAKAADKAEKDAEKAPARPAARSARSES